MGVERGTLEFIGILTLVFNGLLEGPFEGLQRIFVPPRFKRRFPAANEDVLPLREMEAQGGNELVERPRFLLDFGVVSAAVEEAVEGAWAGAEIVRVVQEADDELGYVDNLDAVGEKRTVGVADVDCVLREMEDRGAILPRAGELRAPRSQAENTHHRPGRENSGNATHPPDGGRPLRALVAYAVEHERLWVGAELMQQRLVGDHFPHLSFILRIANGRSEGRQGARCDLRRRRRRGRVEPRCTLSAGRESARRGNTTGGCRGHGNTEQL